MARIWGRIPTTTAGGDAEVLPTYAPSTWTAVETQPDGGDGNVYVTAMIQCFRLNLGESPFYGNFGIPARASVQQQIAPDYNVAFIQSYFSSRFASLIVTKQPSPVNNPAPVYQINAVRLNGTTVSGSIAL